MISSRRSIDAGVIDAIISPTFDMSIYEYVTASVYIPKKPHHRISFEISVTEFDAAAVSAQRHTNDKCSVHYV